MSTGDLRNNLYKLQSKLKKIEFHGYLNCISLGKGDPESFLPLFHFILLDAYPLLADYFASKGYNLYGKKDTRFIECIYKLLRDEFTYKPAITKEQFFSLGFSERKIILTCDIIDMCIELNKKLIRVEYNKSYTTKKSQNFGMKKRNKTKNFNSINSYDYDDKLNFHNPINISNNYPINSKRELYDDDDEMSNKHEKIYQNELDGVMQYPPSRFLKPAWSDENYHNKLEKNSLINEESNYNGNETPINDDYNKPEIINDYDKGIDNNNNNNVKYNYNENNESLDTRDELISYIKLLLESNDEIKKSINSLSERLTILELKVENIPPSSINSSQTENNIMKIKNIIEKEKSLTEENTAMKKKETINNSNVDNTSILEDIIYENDNNSLINNDASLIQEQCVAEEVSIDESIPSSKPSISVQRSTYSQNSSTSDVCNIKPFYNKNNNQEESFKIEFKSNINYLKDSNYQVFKSNNNNIETNTERLNNNISNYEPTEKNALDYLEKVAQNLKETKNIFIDNISC